MSTKKSLKKISPKVEEEIDKEFSKPFDFNRAARRGIYINLNEEIIEYFKDLSAESGRGYQTLIQEALLYFKENKLKPKTIWK